VVNESGVVSAISDLAPFIEVDSVTVPTSPKGIPITGVTGGSGMALDWAVDVGKYPTVTFLHFGMGTIGDAV
jgi:hypothetical protein